MNVLTPVPSQVAVDDGAKSVSIVWKNWFELLQTVVSAQAQSGSTSGRPTQNCWVGMTYFNTQTGNLDIIVSVNPINWKSITPV